MYLDQNNERAELGDASIINEVESCSGDFIGVELEAVPVDSFDPTCDTGENPLIGEEPGPAVSPAGEEQTRLRVNRDSEPVLRWWRWPERHCSDGSSVLRDGTVAPVPPVSLPEPFRGSGKRSAGEERGVPGPDSARPSSDPTI